MQMSKDIIASAWDFISAADDVRRGAPLIAGELQEWGGKTGKKIHTRKRGGKDK